MGKRKSIPQTAAKPAKNIPIPTITEEDNRFIFSFNEFNLEGIEINGEFNNYYEDEKHCLSVLSDLINIVFRNLSGVTWEDMLGQRRYEGYFHFHPLGQEQKSLVEKILQQYKSGYDVGMANLFQVAGKPGKNTAPRLVVDIVGTKKIVLLFIDTNHHLYLDRDKAADSWNNTFCPLKQQGECDHLSGGYCFFEKHLDADKLKESLGV